jgi:hypothetical protein
MNSVHYNMSKSKFGKHFSTWFFEGERERVLVITKSSYEVLTYPIGGEYPKSMNIHMLATNLSPRESDHPWR